MRISVPRTLDISDASKFVNDIESHLYDDDITFDFTGLNFALPIGTMILGAGLRSFIKRSAQGLSRKAQISHENNAQTYLMHVGFFKHIGISIGKETGEAAGSSTYTPIRCLRLSEIREKAAREGVEEIDAILDVSEDISRWIVGPHGPSDYKHLAYAIRESIRNVFDHAQVGHLFYFGQKYRTGRLEFALADEGRGIHESLKEAFGDLTSDAEALEKAILPGATRILGKDARGNVKGNSGFGLYVLSELGRAFGEFTLCSGGASLRLKGGQRTLEPSTFRGTCVAIKMNTHPKDWDLLLKEIVDVGESEAKGLGFVEHASGLSKLASKKPSIHW